MRASIILTVATLAARAVSAVPHRRDHAHQHQNLHIGARANTPPSGTVIVTKTVVEPSAVVWVDNDGNPISTEIKAPLAPTVAPNTNGNPASAASSAAPGQVNQAGNQNQANAAASTAVPSVPTTEAKGTTGNGGYGICYDMINSASQCKTADQVDKDFTFLAGQGFKMVRTYDIGCDIGIVAQKAAAHGLKVFAGINSVSNVAGDLAKLIGLIGNVNGWAAVDTINIGNEQVNQGVAPSTVIAAVNQGRGLLRAAGFNGNVVSVEVFNSWTAELAAASDYVAANAHGFFDTSNTAANNGAWLQKEYDALAGIAGGKKVVITESGWPHAGSSNGGAVPGTSQQETAIAAVKTAFANKQDSLYLFQAYDATYKNAGAMGIEQSFGIFGTS